MHIENLTAIIWRSHMTKFMNLLLKQNQTTEIVDELPSFEARMALGQRFNRMVAHQATQPAIQPEWAKPLSNPFQN
jgi:hypothetical protein